MSRTSKSEIQQPDDYKMTELGHLPEEWRVVRLGDVFDIQQGKALVVSR